jgi:hypothetical protein
VDQGLRVQANAVRQTRGALVLLEEEAAVRPQEQLVGGLFRLGLERALQLLLRYEALRHEQLAEQDAGRSTLALERAEQLVLSQQVLAQQQLAERLARVVRGTGHQRALLEHQQLAGRAPAAVQCAAPGARREPLQQVAGRQRLQVPGQAATRRVPVLRRGVVGIEAPARRVIEAAHSPLKPPMQSPQIPWVNSLPVRRRM